jgi:hypothetical protein
MKDMNDWSIRNQWLWFALVHVPCTLLNIYFAFTTGNVFSRVLAPIMIVLGACMVWGIQQNAKAAVDDDQPVA